MSLTPRTSLKTSWGDMLANPSETCSVPKLLAGKLCEPLDAGAMEI
jgi:hypothetical protein